MENTQETIELITGLLTRQLGALDALGHRLDSLAAAGYEIRPAIPDTHVMIPRDPTGKIIKKLYGPSLSLGSDVSRRTSYYDMIAASEAGE